MALALVDQSSLGGLDRPRVDDPALQLARSYGIAWRSPSDLYKAGDAAPMTCARVCSFEKLEAEGWKKASGTGQWYCRSCGELYARCKPCTDVV